MRDEEKMPARRWKAPGTNRRRRAFFHLFPRGFILAAVGRFQLRKR
jgi:hypothetical protein